MLVELRIGIQERRLDVARIGLGLGIGGLRLGELFLAKDGLRV